MDNTINKKYYTIFNYKMARYLLKNGCVIADIGLNKKMQGVVFHFVNDEKLQKLIALKKDMIEIQKKTREVANETISDNDSENVVENTENISEPIVENTTNNIVESTKPTIE